MNEPSDAFGKLQFGRHFYEQLVSNINRFNFFVPQAETIIGNDGVNMVFCNKFFQSAMFGSYAFEEIGNFFCQNFYLRIAFAVFHFHPDKFYGFQIGKFLFQKFECKTVCSYYYFFALSEQFLNDRHTARGMSKSPIQRT